MEKMYVLWITFMSLTFNTSGSKTPQECENFPIRCIEKESFTVRYNFRDKSKAMLTYYTSTQDTLIRDNFTINIATYRRMDTILLPSDKIDYWIKKSGELQRTNPQHNQRD